MRRYEKRIKTFKDLNSSSPFHVNLFIKQCYHTVWSVDKIQKVKIQKLQGQKTEEQCFHHEVRDSKKSKFFEQQEVTEFLNSFF